MERPKKIKLEWKLSNVLPDLPDERDYIFTTAMSASTLPEIVDNRKFAREIENQVNTNSCVANATVSALELLHKKSNKDINLSRLFLYYNLREPYEHLKNKDKGSYTRDGFKIVNKLGICTEETWKFDETRVNTKPDDKSYLEALNHKVQRYERIPTTYDDDMVNDTKHIAYFKMEGASDRYTLKMDDKTKRVINPFKGGKKFSAEEEMKYSWSVDINLS